MSDREFPPINSQLSTALSYNDSIRADVDEIYQQNLSKRLDKLA